MYLGYGRALDEDGWIFNSSVINVNFSTVVSILVEEASRAVQEENTLVEISRGGGQEVIRVGCGIGESNCSGQALHDLHLNHHRCLDRFYLHPPIVVAATRYRWKRLFSVISTATTTTTTAATTMARHCSSKVSIEKSNRTERGFFGWREWEREKNDPSLCSLYSFFFFLILR